MGFKRWWGHFAAFIGTFVMLAMAYALVHGRHVKVPGILVILVPIAAVIYAFVRMSGSRSNADELSRLRERVARLERSSTPGDAP